MHKKLQTHLGSGTVAAQGAAEAGLSRTQQLTARSSSSSSSSEGEAARERAAR